MSNLLKELEGKRCKITFQSDFSSKLLCEILTVEKEWVKLIEIKKRKSKTMKIIRIDSIKEINQML